MRPDTAKYLTTFVTVIVWFSSVSSVHSLGQVSREARRIDNYHKPILDKDLLRSKVGSLVKSLEDSPNSRGLILAYRKANISGRCMHDKLIEDSELAATIREILTGFRKEVAGRIEIRKEDLTQLFQASFWIIPEGASEPPFQESGYEPACEECPAFKIRRLPAKQKQKGILEFELDVLGPCPEDKYHWSVSAGKIVQGQGTRRLTVDTYGVRDREITVEFEFGGFIGSCIACPSHASITVPIDQR